MTIDLTWHLSSEGQSALAHLRDAVTGVPKKIFGILDKPSVPPTFEQKAPFKLALVGKSGVGKTSLVSFLSNQREFVAAQVPGETPGVRVTTVYWPAKVDDRLILFNLEFWDCGESATKKYNHILPVCKQNASAVLYTFSFTDKSSFEDIEAQLARRSNNNAAGCVIVIGTKYGLEDVQVSQADVARLETKHKLSVLRMLFHQPGTLKNPNETSFALNFICQQLLNEV